MCGSCLRRLDDDSPQLRRQLGVWRWYAGSLEVDEPVVKRTVPVQLYDEAFRPRERGLRLSPAHHGALMRLAPKPAERVLDLGCGAGALMELLRREGARAVGIDYSRESLGIARAAAADGELVLGEVPSLPFRGACFDRIASLGVLGYLSRADLALALAECGRVLRPNGLLVICTGTPLNWVGALLVGIRARRRGEKHRVGSHLFSIRTYVRELERLGFSVEARLAWDGAPKTWWARILWPFFASLWIRARSPGFPDTAGHHRPV
jgi:SAM-dependent methyltransferase